MDCDYSLLVGIVKHGMCTHGTVLQAHLYLVNRKNKCCNIEKRTCINVYLCIYVGYEQFGLMRSDPALCFKALCGEEPPRSKKKNKGNASTLLKADSEKGNDSEGSESGEESDGESSPSTPATPSNKRYMCV